MRCQIIILLALLGRGLPAQILDSVTKPETYLRLDYDNDFFSATDRYYTQGIRLQLVGRALRYSPFSYALIPLGKSSRNYYGLALEQDCFTPRSIRYDTVNYLERPYAATLFLSHSLVSLDAPRRQLLQTQLDLGLIGPCASCEEEQKGIHRALVNIQPLGWEAQIARDYILNYRLTYEKALIYTPYAELMASGALRAGTLYTDGSVGIHARAGWMDPYFRNLGISRAGGRRYQLYLFFCANARVVGYNATMQGGMFYSNSIFTVPASDISRLVYDGTAGARLVLKRVQLEYSRSYITREFVRGLDHGWGRVSFMICL